MNPWQLYDDLIKGIPETIIATGCNTGHSWTSVTSDEGGMGLARTLHVVSMPPTYQGQIAGVPLKKIAELSKSWNFIEASIGVAAIGAYYNLPSRGKNCGIPCPGEDHQDAFKTYQKEVKGLKVVVVGHFPNLEKHLGPVCDMTIMERNPQMGDIPDTACEYILGEQDYVFITGLTLVNKTMPRLLALASKAKVVLVGPSTIMAPMLFDHGVYGLSGLLVEDPDRCAQVLREGNRKSLFDTGVMVNHIRP